MKVFCTYSLVIISTSNVTASIDVLRIAGTKLTLDVHNRCNTTGSLDNCCKIEVVTVDIFIFCNPFSGR